MTEYDDLFEYKGGTIVLIPTPSVVRATFRIAHEELDPDEITRLLKISPDHAHRKGDPNLGKEGRVYSPYRTGVWLFCSKDKLDSLSADSHIQWTLEKFVKNINSIRNFQQDGYRTELICAWFAQSFNTCPALSPETIRILARFGVNFWFEVFYE